MSDIKESLNGAILRYFAQMTTSWLGTKLYHGSRVTNDVVKVWSDGVGYIGSYMLNAAVVMLYGI